MHMVVDVPVVQLQQVPQALMVQTVQNMRFLWQFLVKVLTCPFVQRQSSWSETVQKIRSFLQFLDKVVDVPVVVDGSCLVLSVQELWSSCCADKLRWGFLRALYTGTGPEAVSTGTRLP